MLNRYRLNNWSYHFVVGSFILACLTACGTQSLAPQVIEDQAGGTTVLTQALSLTGAGASFPAPLYLNWFQTLKQQQPYLQIDYQSIGSGASIEQFTAGTIDFGASDVGMEPHEITKVTRGVLLLPMTAGGIVLAYNLPGVDSGLKLPRAIYVDILLGKITQWNHKKIVGANPGVKLPKLPITVVHRADSSGTTAVFTQHLSTISTEWDQKVGAGKSVQWPTQGRFVGAKGNEGITAQVQQTQGAIGYVEYGYAKNNGLAQATLENKAGKFVAPTPNSTATTLGAISFPDNLLAFITDPEGDGSYPVVTYTWLLAYKQYDDPNQALAMELMVQHGLSQGQAVAEKLGYIPLPDTIRQRVAQVADQISPAYQIRLK